MNTDSEETNAADYRFGYCTNVHAGASFEEAKQNLVTYASQIRKNICPTGRLPIGLWLSANAAESLLESGLNDFAHWLGEQQLLPYTLNGFPQTDFHKPVVKHEVYEPTWCCESRSRYTMMLAEILHEILPPSATGSISTLPLGWPHAPWHAENYKQSADNLIAAAKFIDRLCQSRGAEIVIAIEPEPGCVLNTAPEVVEFFEHYLFSGPDHELARKYLTVCHDVCHSGVMFEPQREALQLYRKAGIRVGKVQVSSAVHVPWDDYADSPEAQHDLLRQLSEFNEPKYLHQTTTSDAEAHLKKLYPDLSQALATLPTGEQVNGTTTQFPNHPWRVHFHVPIFVTKFGRLETTQRDISEACDYLEQYKDDSIAGAPWFTGHYEVETYAWPVLPKELAAASLQEGITEELRFFQNILGE